MDRADLDIAKKVALQLLDMPISKTERWPDFASHPFTDSGYFVVSKGNSFEGGLLEEGEPAYDMWKARYKQNIEESEDIIQLFLWVQKPWRLTFFKLVEPVLSDDAFTEVLVYIFRGMEAPNADPNCSISDLVRYFKRCNPALLMDEYERSKYDALPDVVTVYRGVTWNNNENLRVLSWTVSLSVAEWFARRLSNGEGGEVYTATIEKKYIFAYFGTENDHSEHEVVVDPEYLQNITFLEEIEDDGEEYE